MSEWFLCVKIFISIYGRVLENNYLSPIKKQREGKNKRNYIRKNEIYSSNLIYISSNGPTNLIKNFHIFPSQCLPLILSFV